MNDARIPRILIAGATGYVGGRLVRLLEDRNAHIRCLVRRPDALYGRAEKNTEIVKGDLSNSETLPEAFKDVDIAYYLVHSLGSRGDFEKEEELTAGNFAEAARNAGVKRIIYLGGLCDSSALPSPHMRSRTRVGEILRMSGIETVEFRASIIIGSGSLSFELIRALTQRLPVMITPRWVSVKAQPIAISDVLDYLAAAIDLEPGDSRIYEIGGVEQMSYLELMKTYSRVAGLRRYYLPVPVLTPRLSSLWLGLVTPVFASIGRRLIESITTESVVRNEDAIHDYPIKPMNVHDAIVSALRNEDREFAETHWSDAMSSTAKSNWGGAVFGNRIVDIRTIRVGTTPENAFSVIKGIGGVNGWYYANWLWQLRGLLDRAVGGVGMRRGRRDPEDLRRGDVIDCWRVESVEPPRRLVLAAEMRLPGRAWLQFDVESDGDGAKICQTAQYDPIGIAGLTYWYSLYFMHQFVFAGMLRGIARLAEERFEKKQSDV